MLSGCSFARRYWLGCLLAETGWIPDWAIRFGIKKLLDKESRTFRALAKRAGTPEALNGQFIATILDKPSGCRLRHTTPPAAGAPRWAL